MPRVPPEKDTMDAIGIQPIQRITYDKGSSVMTMPFIRQLAVLSVQSKSTNISITDADIPFVFGDYGIPQPHYFYLTWDKVEAQSDTEFNVEYRISNGIYSKGLDIRYLSKAKSPIQINFGELVWPETIIPDSYRATVHITFEFVDGSWQISAVNATSSMEAPRNETLPITIAFS